MLASNAIWVSLCAVRTARRSTAVAFMVVIAVTLWLGMGEGFALSNPSPVEKVLQVGDSEIVESSEVRRAAIGDPMIADVVALSSAEILVNAKSPGRTTLYIWDASGRSVYKIVVQPATLDMDKLCADVLEKLDDPRISVRGVGNTIILEGAVPTEAESSRAEAVAHAVIEMAAFQGTYAGEKSQEVKTVSRPEGDSFVIERVADHKESSVAAEVGLRCPKVVNLIRIERSIDEVSVSTMETAVALRQALNSPALAVRALPGSTVLVEGKVGTQSELDHVEQLVGGWRKEGGRPGGVSDKVAIVNAVEIDTSIARQVMVRARIVDIDKRAMKDFGLDWGRVVTTDDTTTVEDQPFLIGQAGTGPFDLFGGGKVLRLDPIGARVRALEEQNKAKVLSEPNLLVLDGCEASILVGGEIPVPIVQAGNSSAATSISVMYKEFGVRLHILPHVTGEDTLQLKVMPEVSALDFTNAVTFSGFRIPAFRTRRAETIVNMRDGQSLIIGGLLQNDMAKMVKKIPVLGDLPVIGELFKTRSFVDGETELVIVITPQIVTPTAESAER